jgi:LacI family transcriptional regulator
LGTVSRALNKSGRVSAAASAAVSEAAARLGYEPDSVALSMCGRASGVVGVMVSDFANPFFAQVIKAVGARLQRSGYALLVANTDNDRARERSVIELFRRRRVDGLLLGPCESEDTKLIGRVESDYLPVVALDCDLSPTGSGLHVDHFQGAEQATRYVLNLGHTPIALLSLGNLMRPGRERIKGFTAAFGERDWRRIRS